MVLGEVIDKTEQKSDWSAPELSEQQITYALNDAVITARIFSALSDEMRAKSKLHGVDIASGYEDVRYSAAMARDMEHAGVGFDAAAHAAWVTRKAEVIAAIDAHLIQLDPMLTPSCIASGVQLDALFSARLAAYDSARRADAPCLRGRRRRMRGASHSVAKRSPPCWPLIGCSQPSGNWSRLSTHERNIPAVSPPLGRGSPSMSSTGVFTDSCILAAQ